MIGYVTNLITHFNIITSGMPVSHVWRGYGSALFLELGKLTAQLDKDGRPRLRRDGSPCNPDGEVTLMIEWSWRIESEHSIICGSWSDEELWQPSFDCLKGRAIVGITTFGRLPEVSIALSGGLYVASFMTSEGDPQWALIDRQGGITRCRPLPIRRHPAGSDECKCGTGITLNAGAKL